VIASLANYFGERPLDVHLWDSDPERLDLFDRFARLCFRMNKSKHSLMASEETQETLVDASAIVLMVGENCASKYLKARGSLLGHGETRAAPRGAAGCSGSLVDPGRAGRSRLDAIRLATGTH
jgi:hypothetical protein